MKILIVDDEIAIVKSTLMYLKTKGYKNVDTLSDSLQVLHYLDAKKPDLILLDLNMPHITGRTILKKIKELNLTINVIVISAIDDQNVIDECLELGVKDFLVKPLDSLKLIDSLQKLVNK